MFKKIKVNQKLDDCPFCGESAEVALITTASGKDKYFVSCSNEECGCEITRPFDSADEACKAWNGNKIHEAIREIEQMRDEEITSIGISNVGLGLNLALECIKRHLDEGDEE